MSPMSKLCVAFVISTFDEVFSPSTDGIRLPVACECLVIRVFSIILNFKFDKSVQPLSHGWLLRKPLQFSSLQFNVKKKCFWKTLFRN